MERMGGAQQVINQRVEGRAAVSGNGGVGTEKDLSHDMDFHISINES